MALTEAVSTLFEEEWARFTKGLQQLDPSSVEAAKLAWQRERAGGEQASTITVPNISDVLHFGAPIPVTRADYSEFRRAERLGRPPNLSAPVAAEVQRRINVADRITRSSQPDYAKGFGTVLTAVDNVQDFASTLSTFGRLGLWGLPRALDRILPGFSRDVANLAARQAAVAAADAAGTSFLKNLIAEAAAGNPLAAKALADRAALAATRRTIQAAAAKSAAAVAFRTALLGFGSRLAARLVPIVGWVVLASDLLNLMALLATLASPVYALLCAGPRAAIAGGMPAIAFKRALKAETWTMASLNPFSRAARASRAIRAAGKLPGFSNLIEVAQVTDSLFGWGISLGGLVGLMQESVYAALGIASGKRVEVKTSTPFERAPSWAVGLTAADHPATIQQKQQAARVLGTSPIMNAVQDVFTEEEHLWALLALDGALGVLQADLKGRAWQDDAARRFEGTFEAPLNLSDFTRAVLEDRGLDPEDGRRWPIPGTPRFARGIDLVTAWRPGIIDTVTRFIEPRRNAPAGAVYGGLVNQTTEKLFFLFEEDPELLRWHLTPEWKLLTGMIEDGILIEPRNDPGPAWRLWQAALAEAAATKNGTLTRLRWEALGREHGVTMLPLLPPEAPWPEELLALVRDVPQGGGELV